MKFASQPVCIYLNFSEKMARLGWWILNMELQTSDLEPTTGAEIDSKIGGVDPEHGAPNLLPQTDNRSQKRWRDRGGALWSAPDNLRAYPPSIWAYPPKCIPRRAYPPKPQTRN